MPAYSVYLVECADGSLYTGIAKDVQRRMAEHRQGSKGAKYLRGRGPLKLVFEQAIGDRGLALRVESRIKQMPKAEKTRLIMLPGRIDRLISELAAG